jgi:hypothetical protein
MHAATEVNRPIRTGFRSEPVNLHDTTLSTDVKALWRAEQ